MLVAATVLLGAFTVIYGALEPYTRDFVAADIPVDPTPTRSATEAAAAPDDAGDAPTATIAEEDADSPTPTATTAPRPTAADAEFQPDYQVDPGADTGINFRNEPSTSGGQSTVIIALPPGTQLQSQGEQREDPDNPEDNGTWLLFVTEDGQEGWVREIDVVPTG